ncbi:Activating signal cointegrator 1 complex subunit 1 [Dirofilaria immitis]|nr:Activating signal cointegrator 1 complex subunit 1 [Dirofilaria immitis]
MARVHTNEMNFFTLPLNRKFNQKLHVDSEWLRYVHNIRQTIFPILMRLSGTAIKLFKHFERLLLGSFQKDNLLITSSMNFPLFVPTYEIDGRIYRRNIQTIRRNEYELNFGTGDTADLYGESDSCNSSVDASNSSDEMKSTTSESSDLLTTDMADETDDDLLERSKNLLIEIPALLRRFVIGPKGTMKRKIEEETKIVSMTSEESIMRCRDRIELIIHEARGRASYTHFVSIPMTHDIIKDNFLKFVDTIKNDEELSDSCREEAVFQEPRKLHLTITMLSLLDADEEKSVSNSLETLIRTRVNEILDGKPLEVEIKGLEIMNDDPTRVHVLYALTSSEKLSDVVNTIAEAMSDTGFAPQQDSVKIHLTLMNTRYMWEKKKKRARMDVTKLLEKYGNYEFGKVAIAEIHISNLHGSVDERGYYSSIGTFELNKITDSAEDVTLPQAPQDL